MKNKSYKISLSAMFVALIFVATYFIAIPMPAVGYVNLGDAFIILCAIILGPIYGAICGGVGAMLADILLGFGAYAPATLVIKATMAIACYYVYKLLLKIFKRPIAIFAGSIVAELIMTLGYFAFEGFVILHSLAGASLNIAFNLIQGGLSIVIANIIINILLASKAISKHIERINKD